MIGRAGALAGGGEIDDLVAVLFQILLPGKKNGAVFLHQGGKTDVVDFLTVGENRQSVSENQEVMEVLQILVDVDEFIANLVVIEILLAGDTVRTHLTSIDFEHGNYLFRK